MRKIFLPLAALLLAVTLNGAPVELTRKFALSNNNAVVKAGEKINFKLIYECADGAKLGGYQAFVLRKNAPEAFFAQPGIAIKYYDRKTQKINDYDTIYLTDSKNFGNHLSGGECDVTINTAGMAAGDYAVAVQAWMRKDNKSYYPAIVFYLSITEGDNNKFVPTAQKLPPEAIKKSAASKKAPAWYKKLLVTPSVLEGVSGSKYQINCDFTAADRYYFGGYCVFAMRQKAPAEFFSSNAAKIRFVGKDKAKKVASPYDQIVIVPFKHMASVIDQKFDFAIDTAGFPAGKYDLCLEIRLVDRATGKTSYPFVTLPLTVK